MPPWRWICSGCPQAPLLWAVRPRKREEELIETEHNVSLTKGFYLGKYEVTQAQYEAVMTGKIPVTEMPRRVMARQPEPPGGKSSWADAQIFLTRLMPSNRQTYPPVGPMCCPPNRNGNMPAVRERPRPIHGETQLPVRMRIITGNITETILNKPATSANTPPTRGAFLICTEMSGSGPRTGTKRPIPRATRWLIPLDRHRARIGSRGVVPGTTAGRPCVRLCAATPPRLPHHSIGFRVGFQKSQ